jgi:hypothetical protein
MDPAARRAETTAEIAGSLELGIAGHNGVLLRRGERYLGPDAALCEGRGAESAP